MVSLGALALSGCTTWDLTFGPGNSSHTFAAWDASTKKLDLAADRRSTQSGCTTLWFDWSVTSGHYDARAARDCHPTPDSDDRRAIGAWTEQNKVTDVQKAAACTSALEPPNTNSGSNCHKRAGSTSIEGFARFADYNCISWRLRTATGALQINSGGRPDACNS